MNWQCMQCFMSLCLHFKETTLFQLVISSKSLWFFFCLLWMIRFDEAIQFWLAFDLCIGIFRLNYIWIFSWIALNLWSNYYLHLCPSYVGILCWVIVGLILDLMWALPGLMWILCRSYVGFCWASKGNYAVIAESNVQVLCVFFFECVLCAFV